MILAALQVQIRLHLNALQIRLSQAHLVSPQGRIGIPRPIRHLRFVQVHLGPFRHTWPIRLFFQSLLHDSYSCMTCMACIGLTISFYFILLFCFTIFTYLILFYFILLCVARLLILFLLLLFFFIFVFYRLTRELRVVDQLSLRHVHSKKVRKIFWR